VTLNCLPLGYVHPSDSALSRTQKKHQHTVRATQSCLHNVLAICWLDILRRLYWTIVSLAASWSSSTSRIGGAPKSRLYSVEVRGIIVPPHGGSTGRVKVLPQHLTASLLSLSCFWNCKGPHGSDRFEVMMEARDTCQALVQCFQPAAG